MTFEEYQKKSLKTALYPSRGSNYIYPTLGLCGEAGEVAEKIKKTIRDDGGELTIEKKAEIARELGDVLWYLSQVSTECGLELDKIAEANLNKLADRLKRGKISGSGDNR